MTGRVEDLETGFYTRANSVERDNAQSYTQKTELIKDCRRAFSDSEGMIRRRKDTLELYEQEIFEKCARRCANEPRTNQETAILAAQIALESLSYKCKRAVVHYRKR